VFISTLDSQMESGRAENAEMERMKVSMAMSNALLARERDSLAKEHEVTSKALSQATSEYQELALQAHKDSYDNDVGMQQKRKRVNHEDAEVVTVLENNALSMSPSSVQNGKSTTAQSPHVEANDDEFDDDLFEGARSSSLESSSSSGSL
jgi:hypothetical protein